MTDKQLLVSSVGIGPSDGYTETKYVLDDVGDCETTLSPIAMVDILDIDAAFLPCTETALEANDHRAKLEDAFESRGVAYEFELIPKITDQSDVDAVLDTVVAGVRSADSIVLDITHAFRSLPMVFFASLVYLDALGDISLEGVYYGEFQGEKSPIIDLTYLSTLMEWYYALQSYQTTGSLASVHQLLDEKKTALFKQGHQPHELAKLSGKLEGASRALDSGMPLEAGTAIRGALDVLEEIDEGDFVGPEGTFLGPLETQLRGFETNQPVGDKSGLTLDMDEIERQNEIVDFYRSTGRYWLALECARELLLDRLLLAVDTTAPDDWLSRDARGAIKSAVTRPDKDQDDSQSSWSLPDDSPILEVWNRISEYRNLYAHAGHKKTALPAESKVNEALVECCDLLGTDTVWENLT